MPTHRKDQRHLIRLALGTGLMALAMGVLLVFELVQRQTIQDTSVLRTDSVTSLTFQCEREFLRFRYTLDAYVNSREPPPADTLSLRYDIFLSRLTLLRDNPSINLLAQRPEYIRALAKLSELAGQADPVMAQSPLQPSALVDLLGKFNAIGPEVQSLSIAANGEVANLLERQSITALGQNDLIIGLTLAQLLLLLMGAAALLVRHRTQIRERMALEKLSDELREAQRRAEAASRGKSQFLANMSHELRTPFNGLMGMLGLLADSARDQQQTDHIRTAQDSARHLLTLLNDVLDVSALDAGKMNVKPAPLDLSRTLAEVEALMRHSASSKSLDFEVRCPNGPLPWVQADETRLKQILFNLISNAVKFTAQGRICLTVQQHAGAPEYQEFSFIVEDTGIGMDAQALAQLFQRFHQVDNSATRKFGGAGLGLEISQSLAQLMGGHIDVSSQLGVGSTFTLRLALPLAQAAAEPAQASVPQGTAPSEHLGLRVLLVEDNPINQKVASLMLEKLQCEVSTCDNGALAIDQVQAQAFDLVLMDVNMPVMDGLTATRHIRALPGAVARIPIVVVTADVMNDARDQALAAGASDFLAKPLQIPQLQDCIKRMVSTARPGEVATQTA
jgi:signal transduction histidine kinase/ActR/RegA family two-component response regulator